LPGFGGVVADAGNIDLWPYPFLQNSWAAYLFCWGHPDRGLEFLARRSMDHRCVIFSREPFALLRPYGFSMIVKLRHLFFYLGLGSSGQPKFSVMMGRLGEVSHYPFCDKRATLAKYPISRIS
jgi:hypothetical protein